MENKELQVDMKNYIDRYISFLADIVKIINIENTCWVRGESTYSRDLAINLMMNDEHLDYSIFDEFARLELEMSEIFGMSDKDLAVYIKGILDERKKIAAEEYASNKYCADKYKTIRDSIEYLKEQKINIQRQR